MQFYFLNVWQRNYSTGPGAVKACHVWCFTRQHRPCCTWVWRSSAGNWCLDWFRAFTGHLHFSISGHLFFLIFIFQNWSLWQQYDWCCLLTSQQGFKFYHIMIAYLSLVPYLFFIPSANCCLFNGNLLLSTMCLTYFFNCGDSIRDRE